jgi:hypothetical protein
MPNDLLVLEVYVYIVRMPNELSVILFKNVSYITKSLRYVIILHVFK